MNSPEDTPNTPPVPSEADDSGAIGRVHISVDLADGRQVRVTVESLDGEGRPEPGGAVTFTVPPRAGESVPKGVQTSPIPAARPRRAGLRRAWGRLVQGARGLWARGREMARHRGVTLGTALFGLSVGLYLVVRLIGLAEYPIFFFTDEAVQTVLAADLVRDNFFGYDDVFLPTYFRNGPQYNLSLSVYLQVLPYLFFGKSVFVTRATAALVTVIAAISVALILRDIFRSRYWWSGALLLSVTPAWFLHSRTAFETTLATSLYAGFLYFYLRYREGEPRRLYPALALAALTFYSYSPAQVYVLVSGAALAVVDARHHWRNRGVVLRGIGLLALLALPYLRFRWTHSEAPLEHLRALGSYWLRPLPFREKLVRYSREYLYGLSPGYWYVPNGRDLSRHVMDNLGHFPRPALPFAALGLVLAVRHILQPRYRVLLAVALAAPAGAAVVEVGVTRLLVFVIPATLFAALGISQALNWLERARLPRPALSVGLFVVLAAANVGLLRSALVHGPTWDTDYGLGGMQYGARQVFPAVAEEVARDPDANVIVSPTWTNGTDVVARFFLDDPLPIRMASIEGYLREIQPIEPGTLFVLPEDEYEDAVTSGKFSEIEVEKEIPYPDGRPGFYFVRLEYAENVEEIFAAERAERARLREGTTLVEGEQMPVRYSALDMGRIEDIFDGNPATVARTLEANPAVIEMEFPDPREISGFSIIIGSSPVQITARLWATPDSTPVEYFDQFQGTVEEPEVIFSFDRPTLAEVLRVEVEDITQLEEGHVHIWELDLFYGEDLPSEP